MVQRVTGACDVTPKMTSSVTGGMASEAGSSVRWECELAEWTRFGRPLDALFEPSTLNTAQ